MFAGGIEDGVLHRAEKFHTVLLLNAQHRPGQAVKLRLFHLPAFELLPAAAHGDLGPLGHGQADALLFHLAEKQPGVGGKTDGADGEGAFGAAEEPPPQALQVQLVPSFPPHQGVGPAEGRGEEGEAVAGLGKGGVVAPVGLVAQDQVVAGDGGEKMMVPGHPPYHGKAPEKASGVKGHAAHGAAGAGGGGFDEELALRQGEKGVALEIEGGERGQGHRVGQICHALLPEDPGVIRAVLRLEAGILRHGGGEQRPGALQVVGRPPAE